MKTDRLIDILSENNDPVKPLMHPAMRFFLWLLISAAAAASVIFIRTYGFGQEIYVPSDIVSISLLILSVITISYYVFYINIPGSTPGYLLLIPAGIFLLWVIRIFSETFTDDDEAFTAIGDHLMSFGSGHKGSCVKNIYFLLAVPLAAILLMLRNGFTVQKGWTAALAALGTLSVAELGVSIMCAQETPAHLLTWHIIPVIPAGLVIAWAVYRLIR